MILNVKVYKTSSINKECELYENNKDQIYHLDIFDMTLIVESVLTDNFTSPVKDLITVSGRSQFVGDGFLYLNENDIDDENLKITNKHQFFKNCDFKNKSFNFDKYVQLRNKFWISCKFYELSINVNDTPDIGNSFSDCTFNHFTYYNSSDEEIKNLLFSNNKFGIITTNSTYIRMKNVLFNLIHFIDLNENCDFSFESVTIKYDDSVLKELDEKDEKGYLNSYKKLLGNHGLFSQKYTIEKYINYFSSRDNRFYKTLYWFNGGYTEFLFPSIVIVLSLLTKIFILYIYPDLDLRENHPLVPVFYPIDMFKNIILSSFTLNYLCIKIILLLTEVFYIYSVFSLITFIKRKFGFKKEL